MATPTTTCVGARAPRRREARRRVRSQPWPLAVCAALALVACGRPSGYSLEVATQEQWANAPDLRERVDAIVEAAAARFGGHAASLDGYTVILQDERPCSGALGCQEPGVIRVSRWTKYLNGGGLDGTYLAPCVEVTALVHEIGHALIGDHDHHDPRWRSGWEPLWNELVAPPGGCLPGLPYRGTWDEAETSP